ncbi:SIR2 family protein [Vibrio vulnificus]|uniref:SIR2 family NAD-dependent protein deacylase n=1 Tax=Vibrio vulnificus TaxID=672 RepID=UPI0010291CF2|nr:SIR2 family protein [Vibrio vulnificus]RZP53901.1 SIR2 family protein [Vibrio vulnificus]HAS8326498.1 SIR2 family protein [Vibrio vulnificus]
MDKKNLKAIDAILNGDALLFLGAGASKLSKNKFDKPLPVGGELTQIIKNDLGLQVDYPLEKISNFYKEKKGESTLIRLLREYLDIVSIDESYTELASQDWIRVWTTNYDNAYEMACESVGKKFASFSPNTYDPKTKRLHDYSQEIIHINGRLGRATLNLPDDFILTSRDYAIKKFSGNSLSRVFEADLNNAKAIVFVGYSLADLDVLRYIGSIDRLKRKVYFIDREDLDEVSEFELSQYGTILKIGIAGFVKDIMERKLSWKPISRIESYRYFEKVEFNLENAKEHSSFDDFLKLIIQGEVSNDFIYSAKEDGRYTVARSVENEIFHLISSGGTGVFIHGGFGCGKTILLKRLAIQIVNSGVDVFNRVGFSDCKSEVVKLCNREQPFVLIIDDYQKDKDVVDAFFENASSSCSIILAERTDNFQMSSDVTLDNCEKWGSSYIFNIDRLDKVEVDNFIELFNKRAVWGLRADDNNLEKSSFIRSDCKSRLSDLLLELLKSKQIQEKLLDITKPFTKTEFYKDVLTLICVLSCIKSTSESRVERSGNIFEVSEKHLAMKDLPVNENLLEYCFGVESEDYQALVKDKSIKNIIDFETNEIKFKSSIVARYILNNADQTSDITEVIATVVENLEYLLERDKDYTWLCERLVNFGQIEKLLPRDGRAPALINFYERIQNIQYFSEHPLFWLQYSIAEHSLGHHDTATYHLDNALAFGKTFNEKKGFNGKWAPYQINTTYARHLISEAKQIGNSLTAYKNCIDAFEMIKDQCVDNVQIRHPYTSTSEIYDVVVIHSGSWDDEQRSNLNKKILFMSRQIQLLRDDVKRNGNIQHAIRMYSKASSYLNEKSKLDV